MYAHKLVAWNTLDKLSLRMDDTSRLRTRGLIVESTFNLIQLIVCDYKVSSTPQLDALCKDSNGVAEEFNIVIPVTLMTIMQQISTLVLCTISVYWVCMVCGRKF